MMKNGSLVLIVALMTAFRTEADAVTPKVQKAAAALGTLTKFSGVVTSESKGVAVLEDCDGKVAYDFSVLDTSEANPTVGDYYTIEAYIVKSGNYKGRVTYQVHAVTEFAKVAKPVTCKV